jgi:hypothetical protein
MCLLSARVCSNRLLLWTLSDNPLKGPCLVLVIEWQPRWTNMWLCKIHKKLVHRYICDEWVYCIWDMTWSHVTKVEKIKIRLGLMDWLQEWRASRRLWNAGPCGGMLKQWLGTNGPRQRWRASEVKIDEPIRSRDDMKWIISSFVDRGWCICCINIGGDGMKCARQRYNL